MLECYKGTEWKHETKGLRKKVLDIKFSNLDKPGFLATCNIVINKIVNLGERESKYLDGTKEGQLQTLEMGTALTPVDCYIEILVSQMIVGETANCEIKTANNGELINFEIVLDRIEESREFHTLSPKEIYELAKRFKQNGVTMFKKYNKFAHSYFAKGAKCLLSYKPFDGITTELDGVEGKDMMDLLIQLQTNIAACLLTEKRFEDVIYLTQFVDTAAGDVNEKAIYRRAMAYYHIKEYQLAQQIIEKMVPDFQNRKDFKKLHQQITVDWRESKKQYKSVMQRMFN